MDKPIKALERSLKNVKSDIALFSQELKRLDETIMQRRRDIKALDETLAGRRSVVAQFTESASDILNKEINHVRNVIAQRKFIGEQLRQLQKAKIAVELEIAENKNTTPVVPELKIVNQLIGYVKKSLDDLTKKNENEEARQLRLKREVASIEDAERRIKAQKKITEANLKVAQVQLTQAEKEYDARTKALAKESVKLNLIRQNERDTNALKRRLTDAYKKVYDSKPRRAKLK